MVPDAPGQPLPTYTPSTPTAPGNATGSGTVGAPTAPGQVQGAGSGNSPSAPAGVVPSTGTPVEANVTGSLLDGLGASFTFVPLLYAGEYSGRPYFTADGLPVGGFTGNGSFLWYDTTQWKLSHKVPEYGTPLIRFHASAGSEMSPDAVTTWSAITGSGTPVVTVVTAAAAPTAPDTVLAEGAGNSPTAPGTVQPENENPNSPSAPGSVQPVSPSTPDPSDAVRYSAQTPTTEQKTQARANISAAASDHNHSGVYATADQGALADTALQPGDVTPASLTTTRKITHLALVGDSISDANGTDVSWKYHFRTICHALAGGKISVVLNPSNKPAFGGSGGSAGTIRRVQFEQALASRADAIVIAAGTNDYPLGRTAAEVVATLVDMADQTLAAGKIPVICDVLPLPSGQAAKSAWIAGVNSALATAMSGKTGVIYCNWSTALDSNADGVADSDGYFSDSVHPDNDGHSLMGPFLYNKIASRITSVDAFDGVQWLSPNPTMTGTPGVGQIATGWAVDDGSGKTVVKTLIARGGSLGNWQQLAISGSTSVATYFRYGFGTASGGWVVGDTVEFVFEFETDNDLSAVFYAVPSFQTTVSGSTAERVNGMSVSAGTNTAFQRMASGVIVSPKYTIVSNTTAVWPYITLIGTGTIRIGRVGIRRAN